MSVALTGRHGERARDDRAAAPERRPDALQLLRLEIELDAKIVEARRACDCEMVQQAFPVRSGCAHALDLGAADRIEERGGLGRDEEVLSAVHGDNEMSALRKVAEPRPFGPRPLAEAAAS